MLVGRPIWVIREPANGVDGYVEGDQKGMIVNKFLKFLPAGEYNHPDGHMVNRKEHLIQLITSPPGIRTLTAGSIRLSKPRF